MATSRRNNYLFYAVDQPRVLAEMRALSAAARDRVATLFELAGQGDDPAALAALESPEVEAVNASIIELERRMWILEQQ